MEPPEWARWEEDELATLTNEQVQLVMAYWNARWKGHREAADALPEDDVNGRHREMWSAWNCSKWASKSWRVLLQRGVIAPD